MAEAGQAERTAAQDTITTEEQHADPDQHRPQLRSPCDRKSELMNVRKDMAFGRNTQSLKALISDYYTSAPPTIEALTKAGKRICDQLCKQVKGLIERRNDIIHATWFVGWAGCDDTDFSEASGHKWKGGKSGSIIRGEKQEAKDFLLFAEECLETANHVMFLPVIPLLGDHKIERNYCINSEGKVARLPSDDLEMPSSS